MAVGPRRIPVREVGNSEARTAERPRGAIESALTDLDSVINELENTAVSFVERVGPILSHSTEKEVSGEGNVAESGVGVADAISRYTTRVYLITNLLRSTRNRVEL